MIEREYVKLNTSIQTGSNASNLLTDTDGNVEAVIDLRLPENLYQRTTGARKIDHVEMKPTKFRLSMENIPIAQLPLDMKKSSDNRVVSACQLDVYPYSYDDGILKPSEENADLSLPHYKNHKIEYQIFEVDFTDPTDPAYTLLETIKVQANTEGYGVPETSIYYDLLEKTGALDTQNHMMNLCVQTNHSNYFIDGTSVYINSIGTMEQMLQDALENAVTYALTGDNEIISIDLVDPEHYPDSLSPKPDKNIRVDVSGRTLCFWKMEKSDESELSCALHAAFKPRVQIDAQSLSISYDSAAFDELIPIIWNTSYVDTYEQPEQMTLDQFRKIVWSKPPPKRAYKYGVSIDEETSTYAYTIMDSLKCLVMNIIGNKAMRDTFSFLPWITLDTSKMVEFQHYNDIITYNVKVVASFTDASAQMSMGYQPQTNKRNFKYRYRYRVDSTFTFNAESQYASIDWSQFLAADKNYVIFIYQLAPNTTDEPANRLQKVFICGNEQNHDDVSSKTVLQNYWWTDEPTTPTDDVTLSDYTTTTPQTVGSEVIEVKPVSRSDITVEGTETINEYLEGYNFDNDVWVLAKNQGGSEWDTSTTTITVGENTYSASRPTTYIPDSPTDILQQVGTIDVPVVDPDHPDEATTVTYAVWLRAWEIKVTVNTPIRFKYMSQGTFDNVRIDRLKETQTNTRTITIDSVTPGYERGGASKYLPNLNTDNNKFYILDGTNAMVNIGSQELVQTNDQAYMFQITNTFSYDSINLVSEISNYSATTLSSLDPTTNTISPATLEMEMWNYAPPTGVSELPSGRFLTYFCVSTIPLTVETWENSWDTRTRQCIVSTVPYITDFTIDSSVVDHSYYRVTTTPQTTPEDVESTTYSNDPALSPGTTSSTTTTSVLNSVTNTQLTGTTMITPYWKLSYGWTPARIMFGRGAWIDGGSAEGPLYAQNYVLDCLPQDVPPTYVISNEDSGVYYVKMLWRLSDDVPNFKRCHSHSSSTQYPTIGDRINYYQESIQRTDTTTTSTTVITSNTQSYVGNVRLTFTWDNLPMVVMSPVQSIVLTLTGIRLNEEVQPFNIADKEGSSLTSTIPVIENYYSLAQTLRDLHDELVVIKEEFTDCPTYTLDPTSGQERVIHLTAKYITKDGKLHKIFIPPNGVFTVQLTFATSFYTY